MNTVDLNKRLKDYRRFMITLILFSCYFYMGAVINTYMQPTDKGKILYYLTFISIVFATWFFYKQHQIKMKLDKMSMDDE